MKIKNLTSEVQELKVVEFTGGRELTIYVEGDGCVELQDMYLYDESQLDKVFSLIQPSLYATTVSTPAEEQVHEEELHEEMESEDTPEEEPKPITTSDKFICDECGAEFASARGLASHKSRTHTNEE